MAARRSTAVRALLVLVGGPERHEDPSGRSCSPAGDRLYVANRGGTQISVVGVSGRTELRRIQMPPTPFPRRSPIRSPPWRTATCWWPAASAGRGSEAASSTLTWPTTASASGTTSGRWRHHHGGHAGPGQLDRQHAVIVLGNIFSGPVLRYDVVGVNGGRYVLDEDLNLAGRRAPATVPASP